MGNLIYTVGNMGGSLTRCMAFELSTDKISIGCESGLIGNVTYFGVYARGSEADKLNMCSSDASFDTGNLCKGYSSKESDLFLDKLSKCQGKEKCVFHGLHEVLPTGSSYPEGDECVISEHDYLYVQYSCIV